MRNYRVLLLVFIATPCRPQIQYSGDSEVVEYDIKAVVRLQDYIIVAGSRDHMAR
jgi:hypothetical protein